MLSADEVARATQDRCWPIITNPQLSHDERIVAFLEMTATLATYCDIESDAVMNELRIRLGEGSDIPLIDGINTLHLLGDAMANGVALKQDKRTKKEKK